MVELLINICKTLCPISNTTKNYNLLNKINHESIKYKAMELKERPRDVTD
jgi:hypothetical protein